MQQVRQYSVPVSHRVLTKNFNQVYAELRAGIRPPRLLKLHGDFTEVGKNELVAGHADYRQLMVRDVAFSRLDTQQDMQT